jgi:hypothetical protein
MKMKNISFSHTHQTVNNRKSLSGSILYEKPLCEDRINNIGIDQKKYYTLKEAAEILGISINDLYALTTSEPFVRRYKIKWVYRIKNRISKQYRAPGKKVINGAELLKLHNYLISLPQQRMFLKELAANLNMQYATLFHRFKKNDDGTRVLRLRKIDGSLHEIKLYYDIHGRPFVSENDAFSFINEMKLLFELVESKVIINTKEAALLLKVLPDTLSSYIKHIQQVPQHKKFLLLRFKDGCIFAARVYTSPSAISYVSASAIYMFAEFRKKLSRSATAKDLLRMRKAIESSRQPKDLLGYDCYVPLSHPCFKEVKDAWRIVKKLDKDFIDIRPHADYPLFIQLFKFDDSYYINIRHLPFVFIFTSFVHTKIGNVDKAIELLKTVLENTEITNMKPLGYYLRGFYIASILNFKNSRIAEILDKVISNSTTSVQYFDYMAERNFIID